MTSKHLIDTVHSLIEQRGQTPTRLTVGWRIIKDLDAEATAAFLAPYDPKPYSHRFAIMGIPCEPAHALNTRHVLWYVENDLVAVTEVPDPMT